jgi:hypothetical protein
MAKIHDEERENRIIKEVIVDCNDEKEKMMGWYFYMLEGLNFPFKGIAYIPISGGKMGQKKVKISGLDPKSAQGQPVKIGVVENGSRVVNYISPENIARLEAEDENLEIINDWLYWHDFELL